jgi:hypothetical protein
MRPDSSIIQPQIADPAFARTYNVRMGEAVGHALKLFEEHTRGQTRRRWIALAASSAMLGPNASGAFASSQSIQTAPPIPNPAATAATPEAMMQKAQADVRAASDKLAAIEVPMTLEPAFQFRA